MPRPPQHRLPRTQYFVPVGFTHFHPCHLNAADRARIRRRFNPRGIFLNIPYAAAYTQLELATISTATAYELTPMMARQRDTFEIRFLPFSGPHKRTLECSSVRYPRQARYVAGRLPP